MAPLAGMILLRTFLLLGLVCSVLAGADFYKVLGVKRNDDEAVIKKACEFG